MITYTDSNDHSGGSNVSRVRKNHRHTLWQQAKLAGINHDTYQTWLSSHKKDDQGKAKQSNSNA